jgi:hypothetical protein
MVDAAARGVVGLAWYWTYIRSSEGQRWFQQLLTHSDLDPEERRSVLAGAAAAQLAGGDLHAAERHAIEAVELADAAGADPHWAAAQTLFTTASHRKDPAAFRHWYERGLTIATTAGLIELRRLFESQRGALPSAWDTTELIEHYERLVSHYQPDAYWVTASELQFANALYHAGQLDRAAERAHAAIEPARRRGPTLHCGALTLSAALDALGGDPDRARSTATEGLIITQREGMFRFMLYLVYAAAALACRDADFERAVVLLAGAAGHAERLGATADIPQMACRARAQAAVDAFDGDLTTARRRGEAMTLDDLATYTLETRTPMASGESAGC